MRLKLGCVAGGSGLMAGGSQTVVEEIRRDAPKVESRARGRRANAKPPRPCYQRAFVQWFDGARD